jgi:SAM-dependent methyltransferase
MPHDVEKAGRTFDAYHASYSQTVDRAVAFSGLRADFFTRVKAGYILDLAKGHFGSEKTLSALDIGCGVGNYHPILASPFFRLTGVDVSSQSIGVARERHGDTVRYKAYDGNTLPFADGEFDLAFTICVMHHVAPSAWPAFAAEMFRVVRPGGLALVFEHNPHNPLTMRAVNNCPFDEDAVLLKSSQTVELLAQAGFDRVYARFILTIPAANAWLRALDRQFSRLPLGAQYYVAARKAEA